MIKSGEIVQIKDSAYDGLTGLTVYGNTRQNLWQNPSGTDGGVTVTSNEDGSFTVSGTATERLSFGMNVNNYNLKPGGTYTASVSSAVSPEWEQLKTGACLNVNVRKASSNSQAQSIVFGYGNNLTVTFKVITEDVGAFRFLFVVESGTTVSGTYRVMLSEATAEEVQALAQMPVTIPEGGTEDIPQDYPMLLASGDDVFDWCPPGLNSVGDDGSVEIVTAGKNLWNNPTGTNNGLTFSEDENGVMTISGTVPEGKVAAIGHAFDHAEAFRGKTMTVSCNKFLDTGVVLLLGYRGTQTSGEQVLAKRIGGKGGQTSQTVVVNDDVSYFWLAFSEFEAGSHNITDFKVQLELGSTATDYEPPNITTTTIDLQGNTLNALPDGTRDELHVDGDGLVTLVKKTGYADEGSNWTLFDQTYGTAKGPSDASVASMPLANGFKTSLEPSAAAWDSYTAAISQSDVNAPYSLFVKSENGDNLGTIKQAITANNGEFIYRLAAPQVIDLGTVDLPKLQKLDVNTVYVADDTPATIDVEYNRYRSGCDGFKVDGKHNYWDMRACLASRDTGVPEKKLSTVTVPYMSGFYDLSKLYGAIAFESREVTYAMEFVEDTTEELQARKSAILQWLSMVHDADIFDDDFPGYHFHGSYSDASWEEDDSGLQGSLEVTFLCHPFLIADGETSVSLSAGEKTVTVEGQPVNAYAVCASGSATVKFRGVQQSVGTTPVRLSAQLQSGDNAVTVTGSAVTLSWNEERV